MEVEPIRPSDPGYEKPMEAVHGLTGLNRQPALGDKGKREKGKVWKGRKHPSDYSSGMGKIGRGRFYG